ncbi:hypothetical protein [Treponema pectinovorum]|uniref:hypothetical protein n=1 Tax=Treponema pectinovorum TaxID=164 RepID=UPI0011CB9D7B|nr:hypothetical protein [Treponema pectinovorum]
MNSIPLIFNEKPVSINILGGSESVLDVKLSCGLILLNTKGSQFRDSTLKNLVKQGFEQIVSIENSAENYNVENYVHRYPTVKFIIPLEKATEGELINLGMKELKSDFVLVIKDSINLSGDILTERLLEKLCDSKNFCTAPRLCASGYSSIPNIFYPGVKACVFQVLNSSSYCDGCKTLYPLDNIALYDRNKFIQLGGFDYTIKSPHWQSLDLFFRAWLWGEKIKISTAFCLCYENSIPVEDLSADFSYSRFYLKNLLARYDEDHALIPNSSFFVYLSRASCGLLEAIRQFSAAKKWVSINKYRFKFDAKYLVENWGKIK